MSVATGTVRGAAPAKTPTIYNVTSPGTANVEFSQALSSNTKQFIVRVRGTADLQLSFNSGESGTVFLTVPRFASLHLDALDLVDVTLYMQCSGVSQVIEILEWT